MNSQAAKTQALVVLAVAGLSMVVMPGAPTYDPFAWIIWGREIAEGALDTTSGPSWKPLPVFFTFPFSVFGEAAPWLWLLVARAGAIAALLAAWSLARRLGGGVVGAAAAVGAIALAPWWLRNALLGNSEGLTVFFVLASIERSLAGRHRAAFLLACCAGLLRPECWPFLAGLGLWHMWRRELSVPLVIGAGAFVLACWLVPEWWGSGDPFRAASRARTGITAEAPTNADSPMLALFSDALAMLPIPAYAAFAAAFVLIVRERHRLLAAMLGLSVLWVLVVGLMTSGGFSGNQRYLIIPVALTIVLAAAAVGRVAQRLPAKLVPVAAPLAAVVMAAPSFGAATRTWDHVAYQESMTRELPAAIAAAGGASRIRDCGPVATGRYLVPQAAWYLHLHHRQVSQYSRPRGTVLNVRTTSGPRWSPPGGRISPRPIAETSSWRVHQVCVGRTR